jgi:hypothetical protein
MRPRRAVRPSAKGPTSAKNRARRGRQCGGRTSQAGPAPVLGPSQTRSTRKPLAFGAVHAHAPRADLPRPNQQRHIQPGQPQSQPVSASGGGERLPVPAADRRPAVAGPAAARRPTSGSSPGACALTGCRTGPTPPTRAASSSSTCGSYALTRLRRMLWRRSRKASRSCAYPSRRCTYPRVSPRPEEV